MSEGNGQSAREMQIEIERMRVELGRLRAKCGEIEGCGCDVDALFRAAESMGVSRQQICSSSRYSQQACYARWVIASHLRTMGYALSRIGSIINRDHSSVAAGIRRYSECVENPKRDRWLADFITEFENRLNNIQQ